MFEKVIDWLKGNDKPHYFSTPAEILCDLPVPSPIPLETEMSDAVNLDAMNVEGLTKFIEEQEKAHKEKQKALRALLRAKIALTPKAAQEAPAVG